MRKFIRPYMVLMLLLFVITGTSAVLYGDWGNGLVAGLALAGMASYGNGIVKGTVTAERRPVTREARRLWIAVAALLLLCSVGLGWWTFGAGRAPALLASTSFVLFLCALVQVFRPRAE